MSPRPLQVERRSRRRLEVRYGVEIKPSMIGFSNNISGSGMMIRAPRVLPPGSVLQIELRLPQRTLVLKGRVVWAREGPSAWLAAGRVGMGVKFIDPPADLMALVQAGAPRGS